MQRYKIILNSQFLILNFLVPLQKICKKVTLWNICEARDKGDLSENFEYHAAKREQGRLLSRIRFMQRVLENARVLDTSHLSADSVGLLSKVEMTNENTGSRMSYTIVSPHEANLREGKISIKSPIAQALLNKKAGDTVVVRVPAGMVKLRIESVSLTS